MDSLKFSEKQMEFWKNAHHRWNVKTGATRSGKTFLDYFIIAKRVRECTGSGLIVLLGNTNGTLCRNILDPMRGIWGGELVGFPSSNNTVRLFGKKCYILGADKVSQVARLQGSGIEYCYGDEVTTWHEDVFNMLKSRLDKPNSHFDGTCNPDNPNHWFKKFLDKGDLDLYHQAYTIDDNPFLDAAFVRNLKQEYAGTIYYDRFILGRWIKAEGLVYPMFNKEFHVVPTVPRPYELYFISCDYGTVNPMSMGLWGRANGVWYRVREYYWNSRAEHGELKTDEDYYSALEELAGDLPIEDVIVDPSAASFIACINRHDRFSVRKADNEVINGIRQVAAYLKGGRLFFNDCCEDSITEFLQYVWDEKSAEDRPVKENDHAMDDIRYFVHTAIREDN